MDTLFFWISKLAWLIIAPDSLIVIIILTLWLLLWRGHHRLARRVSAGLAVFAFIIALLPVGKWLLYPLDSQFLANPELPEQVDGIVVLSGSEALQLSAAWNQVELSESAERLLAFLALAKQYPQAKLVYTGGSGSLVNQSLKGADVAKRLFKQQGLDLSRVKFESASRNTYENATLTYAFINPKPNERWILITTASHMPRSIGVFCQAGWPMIPYPVDHRTVPGNFFSINWGFAFHLKNITMGVKEWIGLFAYYLTGKTPALVPNRCQ